MKNKNFFLLTLSTITLFTTYSIGANKIAYENEKNPMDLVERQFYLLDDYWNKSFHHYQHSIKTKYIAEDKQYILILEIPGYDKENVVIKLNGNKLFITGEIIDNKDNKSTKHLDKNFSFSFTLKDDVDRKTINSSLKNGILTINLPRIELKTKDATTITIN